MGGTQRAGDGSTIAMGLRVPFPFDLLLPQLQPLLLLMLLLLFHSPVLIRIGCGSTIS